MNRANFVAIAGIILSSLGIAQSPISQTLPPGYESAATGSTSTVPFGTTFATFAPVSQGMYVQYGYQSTMFNYQSVQRIDSIAFRVNNGTAIGGTTGNVSIYMSTSPMDITVFSTTFTVNQGADRILVYNGPIVWPAGTITAPGQWVTVPLQTTFTYDPHGGKDFLLEVVCPVPTTLAAATIQVSFGPTRSQYHTTNPLSLLANTGTITAALVRIDSTPIPHLVTTSVNGDFTLALNAIPNNAVVGWTIISEATGNPVDTGPILGIYPSQLSLDILFTVPSIGNPLAWINSGQNGLYPTTPIYLGPGSIPPSMIGLTWDFVTMTLDANYQFAQRSNVQRVTF